MSEVKTYAVNCNDAWLNTDGDDISGSYVKYADYMALATKLDLAERACAELAAENAWMKSEILKASEDMEAHHDDHCLFSYDADGEQMDALLRLCDAQDSIASLENSKTPATDAFLDEVRAQGVDSAINRVIAMMNHQHPVTSKAIDIMRVHAYQLRKGGEQK